MDYPAIYALVSFVLLLMGAAFAAWWRVENRIDRAKSETMTAMQGATQLASLGISQVAELRTHVAENYVSKQGHREATEQIMAAIRDVKGGVDALGARIDRVYDYQPRHPAE